MDRVGLQIIDVDFNDINGGSFTVTVGHPGYCGKKREEKILRILDSEEQYKLFGSIPTIRKYS